MPSIPSLANLRISVESTGVRDDNSAGKRPCEIQPGDVTHIFMSHLSKVHDIFRRVTPDTPGQKIAALLSTPIDAKIDKLQKDCVEAKTEVEQYKEEWKQERQRAKEENRRFSECEKEEANNEYKRLLRQKRIIEEELLEHQERKRNIMIPRLCALDALLTQRVLPHRMDTWKQFDDDFVSASRLWRTGQEQLTGCFTVEVHPRTHGQFRIYQDDRWMRDTYFRRQLLAYLYRCGKVKLIRDGSFDFGEDGPDWTPVSISSLMLAFSLKASEFLTLQEIRNATLASHPLPSSPLKEKLLGWDESVCITSHMRPEFGPVFDRIKEDPKFSSVRKLVNVVKADGGAQLYTRQLGIIVDIGDYSGERNRIADARCYEFGLQGGVYDDIVNLMLGKIRNFTGVVNLHPVFVDSRNRWDKVFAGFMTSATSKVALVGWASHCRIMFREIVCGAERLFIVDSWKTRGEVRPPPGLENAEWIKRLPEQQGEGSCVLISLIRACIICRAITRGESPRDSATSNMLESEASRLLVVLVRIVHLMETTGVKRELWE